MKGNFLIEEFDKYKVFLYGKKMEGEQTDYGVDLTLPSGTAYLRFCKNYMKDNYINEVNGKKYFHIFLRADKYPAFIDILRNETPLFFFYNFNDDSFYLTTGDEPVGENETTLNKLAGEGEDH
jgi:hypothetical protein